MYSRLRTSRTLQHDWIQYQKNEVTYNSTYHARLLAMDADTVNMVMHWINKELGITSPLKLEDKNRDLFEFMSL